MQRNAQSLLVKYPKSSIFHVEYDRSGGSLSTVYKKSYPIELQQEFNCQTCSKFMKNYGDLALVDEETGALLPLFWNPSDNIDPFKEPVSAVANLLASGKRVMGMGHREYKIRDPRAEHLEKMAKQLAEQGDPTWYALARKLEDVANGVLQELKPGRRIYANVDFYTAPTLGALGIPSDEYTCLFACSRVVGWSAHVLEQYQHNRLIRPQAEYVGPEVHPYEPIAQRHSNGKVSNGAAT